MVVRRLIYQGDWGHLSRGVLWFFASYTRKMKNPPRLRGTGSHEKNARIFYGYPEGTRRTEGEAGSGWLQGFCRYAAISHPFPPCGRAVPQWGRIFLSRTEGFRFVSRYFAERRGCPFCRYRRDQRRTASSSSIGTGIVLV